MPTCDDCGLNCSNFANLRRHCKDVHWTECGGSPNVEVATQSRTPGDGARGAAASTPATVGGGDSPPSRTDDEELLAFWARARVIHHVPRKTMQALKQGMAQKISSLHEEVRRLVEPHLVPGASACGPADGAAPS